MPTKVGQSRKVAIASLVEFRFDSLPLRLREWAFEEIRNRRVAPQGEFTNLFDAQVPPPQRSGGLIGPSQQSHDRHPKPRRPQGEERARLSRRGSWAALPEAPAVALGSW